jgi:hypothetical protein
MISASSDAMWDALGYASTPPNAEQHLRQIIERKQHTTTNLILPYLIAINMVERIVACAAWAAKLLQPEIIHA